MGLIRHHAIIVTGHERPKVDDARIEAFKRFGRIVSGVVESIANGYYTFFVGPDGSKEGWRTSNDYDEKRADFMKWLADKGVDTAEVQYFSETGVTWVRGVGDGDEAP
jgi:hypothetical protein